MWLLKTDTLELEYFVDERATPYAILSHTWGDEEVTFQEMRGVHPTAKKGYRKIQQTCQQALRDDWNYVWIDTCCINKESSAELSEAINSMFSYYAESRVCYVYLADVSIQWTHSAANANLGPSLDDDTVAAAVRVAIQDSRWFTRGWTLQELIAPSNVLFFDKAWIRIGSRTEMCGMLTDITKIDGNLLSDPGRQDSYVLSFYSVAARMSWAANRKTTRLEDRAYSLLGIFGINMPLLYGEGSKAFQRLQEEIVARTDDQSIFAWEDIHKERALFASDPVAFVNMSQVVRWPHGQRSSSRLTSSGIEIELPIFDSNQRLAANAGFAVLNCHFRGNLKGPLAICVVPNEHNESAGRPEYSVRRYWPHSRRRVETVPHTLASRASVKTVHLEPRFPYTRVSTADLPAKARWHWELEGVWVHTSEDPMFKFETIGSAPEHSWSDEGLFKPKLSSDRGHRIWSAQTSTDETLGDFTIVVKASNFFSCLWMGLFEGSQTFIRSSEAPLHDASLGEINIDLGSRVRITARANVRTTIMGYRVHEIIISASPAPKHQLRHGSK